MLVALGLALGVVGAAVLAVGLFRPSKPLLMGWSRDPLQAATDQAFGITGFLFLGMGFLLQGLPLFGVQATGCAETAEIAAAAGLIGGGFVAWIGGEGLRAWRFSREKAYTAKTYQPYMASLVLGPGIERAARLPVPRLWRLAYVNIDWLNCNVTAAEPATGGFTLIVPMTGFREATWDEAFDANASDPQSQPPNQTWDTPRVRNDQLVVLGMREDTDLTTLRRYVDRLVYTTNEQEETRRTGGSGSKTEVAQLDVDVREAHAQRMAEMLRRGR